MNDKINVNFELIRNTFLEFINNKAYMFSIIITTILSYGFYLINISIGIDDLVVSEFVKGPYLLASGRYTFVAIGWILQYFIFTPFWIEFFSIIILIISLILINVLMKLFSNNRLPNISYVIFSIMFLSYSIISESLIYQENGIFLAFGYFFTTISVIYTYRYFLSGSFKYGGLSILFFALALGLYETFLSVYLTLILMVLILQLCYSKSSINFSNSHLKKFIERNFEVLVFSICIKIILLGMLNFSDTKNFSNQYIVWIHNNLIESVKILIGTFYDNVICQIGSNLSFSILLFSFIAYIILSIEIKKSKILFILLFISAFIIQIIMGLVVLNRTLNSLSIYVSFAFCLLYAIVKNDKIKKGIIIFVVYLCLLSSKNINDELYKDFKRYNYEKYIINQTAFVINNKFGYTDKPVVFVGKVNTPFTNDYNSEIGESVINWSIVAFEGDMRETHKLFLEHGHKFNLPTLGQIKEANNIYENLPRFPQEGSVKLINDEYIIVRY